jgi:serine/threonine protein kinase
VYGTLALLTAAGVVADRGILPATHATLAQRVLAVVAVEAVLLATYVAARANRRAAVAAVEQHDRDVRLIAAREALLREARADLERALKAGDLGRFTDSVVGPFRLGRVLGRGGMGEVYAAEHVDTHAPAAVKPLHTHVLGESDLLRRFLREAKIISSIDSPHVVRVLECGGLDATMPYIAMELLSGEDLAEVLHDDERLPFADVLVLVREVGGGLDAARRSGIVHRDLKPRNVFHATLGGGARTWKILDFGVSKLVGTEGT